MIKLDQSFPKITTKDLENFEKTIHLNLPDEYRGFMLEINGGAPQKSNFSFPDLSNQSVVNYFYPIGNSSTIDSHIYNLAEVNEDLNGEIADNFITIGNDSGGNQILIGVSGDEIGKVYFWEHDVDPEEENPMHFLANSFNDFLKMLHE